MDMSLGANANVYGQNRQRRWSGLLSRLVAVALLVGTSVLADDVNSLRLTITDLTATYGKHYPRGTEFLKRLGRIETTLGTNPPTTSADFLQLQREALLANPLVGDQPLLFVVRRQYQHDHYHSRGPRRR